MNNQESKNIFKSFSAIIKKNIKFVIILFSTVFLAFLAFQGLTTYKINKINNTSKVFFNSKNLDDNINIYEEMEKISNDSGFYSILSKLELIKINLSNNEYELSLRLYKDIVKSKNIDNNYISLVAINAAYNFIGIVSKNKNYNFIDDINEFISLIDDNLENYIGNKNELTYLVSILNLKNESEYKNNSQILSLYESIMENEKISSTIKVRVKKLHEFYSYI